MKKSLLAVIAAVSALFCTMNVQAQGKQVVEPDQQWDLLQIGMLKSSPTTQDTAPVYGVRFGLPICGGKAQVSGVDFALIGSQSDKVIGFQYATCFNVSNDEVDGVRLSVVNAGGKTIGAEIGVVNLTKNAYCQFGAFNWAKKGFQLGIINVMEDGFLPVMILINFSVK